MKHFDAVVAAIIFAVLTALLFVPVAHAANLADTSTCTDLAEYATYLAPHMPRGSPKEAFAAADIESAPIQEDVKMIFRVLIGDMYLHGGSNAGEEGIRVYKKCMTGYYGRAVITAKRAVRIDSERRNRK